MKKTEVTLQQPLSVIMSRCTQNKKTDSVVISTMSRVIQKFQAENFDKDKLVVVVIYSLKFNRFLFKRKSFVLILCLQRI